MTVSPGPAALARALYASADAEHGVGLAAHFAPDARLHFNGAPPIEGAVAIEASVTARNEEFASISHEIVHAFEDLGQRTAVLETVVRYGLLDGGSTELRGCAVIEAPGPVIARWHIYVDTRALQTGALTTAEDASRQ